MSIEAEGVARGTGLRYVTDADPGIRRRRAGRGFTYLKPDGTRLGDERQRAWIRSLAIPPAWTDVWICPTRHGHLQATGRDARGRKQYRYHPKWRPARDELKYERLVTFARALPRIRRRVDRDLRRRGLPRDKVLAAVVRLLERTRARIGNAEYARDNRSFGLTTLRDRHVTVGARRVRFRYRAKGGAVHEVAIDDPRLARVIGRCQELPGQELFQYVDDDGTLRDVSSEDVNDYLGRISGAAFTAKDFRTWAGTVAAARALEEFGSAASAADGRRNLVAAIKEVAAHLGNTPAVSRAAYVHPAVLDDYLARAGTTRRGRVRRAAAATGLRRDEEAVLALLEAGRRKA
jgi:DNA topoisomerase-1